MRRSDVTENDGTQRDSLQRTMSGSLHGSSFEKVRPTESSGAVINWHGIP